jgi:ribonuclease P protein component
VSTAAGSSTRFSRQSRLRKHADFEKVYRSGRRIFSAHLTVFFLRRDGDLGPLPQPTKPGFAGGPGPARVGFTVARTMGVAVVRNRIRRRLREAARLNLGTVGDDVDVVIHPKKSALTAEFAELCREVAGAFTKIRSSPGGGAA